MTHEETIKRIQKLVPSVMALEFGCEVDTNGGGICTIGSDYAFDRSNNRLHTLRFCDNCPETQHFPITEILGKPITLAVLFQAFENNKTEVELSIFANKILIGHYEKPNQEGYYTHCYWNLSKDNFNDQSEETKGFIGGLLGN